MSDYKFINHGPEDSDSSLDHRLKMARSAYGPNNVVIIGEPVIRTSEPPKIDTRLMIPLSDMDRVDYRHGLEVGKAMTQFKLAADLEEAWWRGFFVGVSSTAGIITLGHVFVRLFW